MSASAATSLDSVAGEHLPGRLRGDSLARGMALLVGLTIGQRLVGVVRNILFCRWMSTEQLGLWELSFSFVMMLAPLCVLGVPCSLSRYVEYYRARGQLLAYLRRVVGWSLGCAAASLAVVWLARFWIAQLIYDRTELAGWMLPVALMVAAMIVMNLLCETLNALRLTRTVTLLRFGHALTFSAASLTLLAIWPEHAALGVLWAFAGATLAAVLVGCWHCLGLWNEFPDDATPLVAGELWRKLTPIIGALWIGNVLGNFFEIVDRWMIVHCSGLNAVQAASLVGQYYSCRMIPLLILGVAASVEGLLLPHLSCDWEAERRDRVGRRLTLAVKLTGLVVFSGGVLLLTLRPLVFGVLLQGRYELAAEALPPMLAYTAFAAMLQMTHLYLTCAERPGLANAALAAGIVCNIGLNLWWLPRYGLLGAAWATAIAGCCVLAGVLVSSVSLGLKIDRRLAAVALLPFLLAMPAPCLFAVLAILVWATTMSECLLTRAEQDQFATAIHGVLTPTLRRIFPVNGGGS